MKIFFVVIVYGILFFLLLKLILFGLNEIKIYCFKFFNIIVDDFIFVGVCLFFIDYIINIIFCSGLLLFYINM